MGNNQTASIKKKATTEKTEKEDLSKSLSRSFYLQNLEAMRNSYNLNLNTKESLTLGSKMIKDSKFNRSNINLFKAEDGLVNTLSTCNILVHLVTQVETNKLLFEKKKTESEFLPVKAAKFNTAAVSVESVEGIMNDESSVEHQIRHKPLINKSKKRGTTNKDNEIYKQDDTNQESLNINSLNNIEEESERQEASFNNSKFKLQPYKKKEDALFHIFIDLRDILKKEGIEIED